MNHGEVYLMWTENGLIKIGRSKRSKQRFASFAILPYRFEIIHVISTDDNKWLEACLHLRYAEKRVMGEWFRLEPEDVAYLKSFSEIKKAPPLPRCQPSHSAKRIISEWESELIQMGIAELLARQIRPNRKSRVQRIKIWKNDYEQLRLKIKRDTRRRLFGSYKFTFEEIAEQSLVEECRIVEFVSGEGSLSVKEMARIANVLGFLLVEC